jgi:hemoglobin/transferrin/lactoferrin receptor protein
MGLVRRASLLAFVLPLSVKSEVQELEEAEVTALELEEPKVEASASRIKAADILNRGAVTLPDILQREPGVSIPLDVSGVDPLVPYLEGGSAGINVRGLQGNRIRIAVDGIPQPDDFVARSFDGAGGPGRIYFDPAVFSSIDIQRTAAPGSGALAGGVSGQTESPFTLLGETLVGRAFNATSTWSSNNDSFNQRFAGAWGNGSVATSLVYSYRTGHELENNSDIPANPADFDSHAVVWKSVFRRNGLTLTPTIDYFENSAFTELRSIEIDSLVGRTENATSDSARRRFRASLEFDYELATPNWFADRYTGMAYFQSSSSTNLNLQDVVAPTGDRRARVNDLSYLTDRAGLILGAFKEFQNHRLSYQYQGARSDISGSLDRIDNGGPESELPNLAPSITWEHSLSIVDEISLGDRWRLTPSLRFQYYEVNPTNTPEFLAQTALPVFDQFGRLIGQRTVAAVDYDNFFVSPALQVEYRATDGLTIFGSYTRGFRNPTAGELAGVFINPDSVSILLPNPALEAEDSHSFELGVRHQTGSWDSTASIYYNRFGNFLENNAPTGEVLDGLNVLTTRNTRNAEIYGIELKTEWRGYAYRAGGTFAWSEGESDDGPLNTVEPWKAVAWLGYDDPDLKWGMELAGTYVAANSASDITGEIAPTDDYFLLDAVGYYRFNDHLVLRGGLRNILDQEYVLWARANRGSGHAGGVTTGLDTQPGINGFLAFEITF